MAGVMGFLKMFDKIDDIVYEPVKTICDFCRQPLKNSDAKNERRRIDLEAELQRKAQVMEQELETKRKRDEMLIEMERKQKEVEIDDFTEQKNFEREMQKAEFIKQYQEDITRLSSELHQALGNMSLALRERANELVFKKTQAYMQLQEEAKKSAIDTVIQMNEALGDDEESKKFIRQLAMEQWQGMLQSTTKFLDSMKDDIQAMQKNIDEITKQSMDNMNKYLSPINIKNISYNDVNRIER